MSTDDATINEGTTEATGDLEAVLLAAGRAVPPARLAQAIGLSGDGENETAPSAEAINAVRSMIDRLNADYERTNRSFRVEEVSGGFRLMTLPAHAKAVSTYQRDRTQHRLSRAAVETLAVIAYRQPVTRAELESIRGVACGEILKTLLERKMVAIKGRAEELGRPMLYATTRQFLDSFGLASLQDLPGLTELRPPPAAETPSRDEAVVEQAGGAE